jgi:hypothetical protein
MIVFSRNFFILVYSYSFWYLTASGESALSSLPGSCTKSTTNVLGGNFGAPGYK